MSTEVLDTPAKIQICQDDIDQKLLDHYLKQEFITVDTETRGLVVQRDRLCLVQIASADGTVALIRFTKKSALPKTGKSNLRTLMETPQVLKVFHFARFDVAVLKYYLSASVQPLWCTKIASKLVRTYADRHGLRDLASDLLGIDMDKTNQTSDWAAEDLTESQLTYAANDVRLLIPIYKKMKVLIERENLTPLAQKLFAFVGTISELDLGGWKAIFEH